jgi:tetratricopeptide (TPR) repeat protein/transcriptional regulator with XRE-family HTH domain
MGRRAIAATAGWGNPESQVVGGDVQQDVEAAGPAADQVSLAVLVRAHRRRMECTQEELAERAGLSERTLRNLEGGRIRRPYPDTIRRLADALQLTGPDRDQLKAAARRITPGRGSEGTVPSLLPPSVADFTGREEEAASVLGLLTTDGFEEGPHAVVISAVAGKPGIGKTTLAIHVAHRLRDEFPDGQLYVNLQGAQTNPLEPGEVLARFLRALGADGSSIPDGLEERAERYRTLLAGQRVLVVLDNAASEAQVRPLLPGSPTCRVLVTSRARLVGLEGARLVDLDILSPEAAVELLARVAGPARVAAEPEAAAAIVGYCGRLPLAIRIAGSRLAARPAWSLARLAERLADERRRLDELAAGDLEVRASLALSYRALPDQQQQAFRRLGLLDAPDFPAWVAAAVLDLDPARGEDLVDGLVDAQLLELAGEDAGGQLRYRFHDLLRVYARERAAAEDLPDDQDLALARAFDGWLGLAGRGAAAAKAGTLDFVHGDVPRWRPGPAGSGLVDGDPLAWFEAERASLVAAVHQAAGGGLDELAWDLAGCLARFFAVRSYFDDWRQTQETGLAAARRSGHRRAQAHLLRGLGLLHNEQDRLDAAAACFEQARALFVEVGDRSGEAGALDDLGVLHQLRGHSDRALACLEPALAIFTEAGDPVGEANVRFSLGMVHLDQGDYDQAEACLQAARPVLEAAGDRYTLGQLLRKLAQLHETCGRLEQAAAVLDHCLAVDRALGDRLGEALTLQSLGELQRQQDRRRQAQVTLEQALATLRDLSYPYGEALALRSLGLLHLADGRPRRALVDLGEALTLWRRLGRPRNEAHTLTGLGDAHTAAGDRTAAETAWREALTIFQELGAPDTQALADRLSTSAAADPGP